jgi:hypothetical protein
LKYQLHGKFQKTYINEELNRLQKQRADTFAQLTAAKCTASNVTATLTTQTTTEPQSQKGQEIIVANMTDHNLKCDVVENNMESNTQISKEWRSEHCVYLFSVLFRRCLDAQERFAIHRVFQQYGPFKEKTVRRVIGRLLGESHPTSDLNGYLEALRIESRLKEGEY